MASETLKNELKGHIIEQLNLEDVKKEDFVDEAPLFGEGGVGLDSIDALELIVLLEKHYHINVTNPEEGKVVFYSIDSMADYIEKHRK